MSKTETIKLHLGKYPIYGSVKHKRGFVDVYCPSHPKARAGNGRVMEHTLIAETALGKLLPDGVVIHHVDGEKGQKDESALVICQDEVYHRLLHLRERALKACGHSHWRRCSYCKEWDEPKNLYIKYGKHGWCYHKKCNQKFAKEHGLWTHKYKQELQKKKAKSIGCQET